MYAAIRTYQTSDAAECARRVNHGVPILRGTPGFVATTSSMAARARSPQ